MSTLTWDWGDGTTSQSWFPASHRYYSNTTYTVTVAASPTGETNHITVTITNGGDPSCFQADMALIPSGSFQMGDSFGEGLPREQPVHNVYVSAFYIDKYEVTTELWDSVAGWAALNGYDIRPSDGADEGADHPTSGISWYVAVKWANARSEIDGRTPCYTVGGDVYRVGQSDSPGCNWSADGYRLPTEAEWEKAARGGVAGHRFPWSNTDTIDHGWANYYSFSDPSYDTGPTRGPHPDFASTSPVGSFPANGYGLWDMAGSVCEWCWDWYDASYYASSPGADPRGPTSGSERVLRGGAWSDLAYSCRVAYRGDCPPDFDNQAGSQGFRLVRTAP